jgi:formate hydrogenlyase subunit 3/multisubunit Na+/H+ antiporter MnhD subunit
VAVVKSGVFAVTRMVGFIFGTDVMAAYGLNDILIVMAGSTIILASLIAFAQDNLKRRLAYSTVGHLSYIVLGVALLTPLGMTGGIMHIAAHATMKITLFFCAGSFAKTLGRKHISQLAGVGRRMPLTMIAFTIAAFGMIGTLVGLVNMLEVMYAGDLQVIGPRMAVALLTTFYGILLANLVFKPIAVKLERRTEERLITMNMVLEGISLITKRRLPSFIEETLNSFVANFHDEIRDNSVKPRPATASSVTKG